MERTVAILHVSLELDVDFEGFTRALERLLGRFDEGLLAGLATAPARVEERLGKAAGEEGLMLFAVRDHGLLQAVHGSRRQARQYVVGNPLVATDMTRHDIRAGLYAPLRLLVYAPRDGVTAVEYDQPSSLFGQFGNDAVTAVARSLDAKVARLVAKARSEAGAPEPA